MGTTARAGPREYGKGRICPSNLVYPDCAVVRVCGVLFRLSPKKTAAPVQESSDRESFDRLFCF